MTAPALLRSNIEFAKRVFLDRLTTDAQPLGQANRDEGPGDEYLYAGVFDPYNFGVSADCSGLCGIVIGAAVNGPDNMQWTRQFSTETFPSAFSNNFRQTTKEDLIAGDYPIKVCIMHGGGGPDSHMACQIDGWNMESNGDHGVCTAPGQITGITSSYWNDWWVCDAPITEDTTRRQPMSYPLGLDYAGGRPSGADLAAADVSFVCRYLTDGGSGLPNKQLTASEFIDLVNNGIDVVFNYETTATFMLEDEGVADATDALAYINTLLTAAKNAGISIPEGYKPVVYFSADFDEAPDQDTVIENYLLGAKGILGTNAAGNSCAGLYGAYYICMRAQNAGAVDYLWQTEAWSGGNIVSTVNIMQRNGLGYQTVDGVQCDINEAHTDDIGAFSTSAAVTPPTPPAPPAPVSPSVNADAIPKPSDQASQVSEEWDQLLIRWDFLGGRTPVETLGAIAAALKIAGCYDPLQGGN